MQHIFIPISAVRDKDAFARKRGAILLAKQIFIKNSEGINEYGKSNVKN